MMPAGHDDEFINPYTFVPFPDPGDIVRAKPAWHEQLGAGRFCGQLSVSASARTPIMVGGWDHPDGTKDVDGEPEQVLPWRPGRDGAWQAIVPGSSVAGAVRSLHEVLAGGCLRVFDRDFVPTYRDAATPGAFTGLKLALVSAADETGRPTALRICTKVVWTDAVRLRNLLGKQGVELRTGLTLSIPDAEMAGFVKYGREIVDITSAIPDGGGGEWVVLLGDAGAREGVPVYRLALGRLPPLSTTVRFPEQRDLWASYRRRALDTADMRGHRKDAASLRAQLDTERAYTRDDDRLTASVEWANAGGIGRRQLVRPWMLPGTVTWVKTTGGNMLTDIRRAVLWRGDGAHPAGARVAAELLACTDPTTLCPSCRLFGSADVEGRKPDDQALQASYAGHVRFSDLIADSLAPDGVEIVTLAPLSSPNPGAGQFYLDNGRLRLPEGPDDILRRWGSPTGDATTPRRLRGRKFYWQTTDQQHDGPERSQRRHSHTNEEVLVRARLFPVGQRFTGTISFDGLTEAELGGLLAAVSPSVVIDSAPRPGIAATEASVCVPVGGGKPFGFGAMHTRITLDWIASAGSRYRGAAHPAITTASAVAAFTGSVPQGIRDRVWKALHGVLTVDHVDPTRVWYPPGASWAAHDANTTQEITRFDEGYQFWKLSQGQRLNAEDRPLVPLPPPTGPQYLPMFRKRGR